MSGKNEPGARTQVGQIFDKNCSEGLELFDDMTIVDNLMFDIDRRAIKRNRAFDCIDRSFDARAKPTRFR